MDEIRSDQSELRTPGHINREWFGVLGGPFAWSFGLLTKYALVPFVCGSGDTIWLHAVSIATLLVALGATVVAYRNYRLAGGEWSEEGALPVSRSRFMAASGMLSGGLFALAICAQWLTSAFLNPCMAI
jgi:hypothetical protein